MADRLEELNVTAEELRRFQSAFQDPRFRELFTQYAEEIRDPENRRLYEREIAEMERERGMNVEFLRPQPGYVLHTAMDRHRRCYLNVCGSDLVDPPRCVPGRDREGRHGQHWSLPCALSPARDELSPEKKRETIYDVFFHPETLRLSAGNAKFKSLVDLTALDSVSRSFHVVLDTANVRTIEGQKYRGVPQSCVVRRPIPGAAQLDPDDPSDPLRFPYPYGAPKGHPKTQPNPGDRHGTSGGHQNIEQLPRDPYSASRGHPKARALRSEPRGHPLSRDCKVNQEPTVPRYTIRHRSYVDMQDYRDARDAAPSPVPKELVITIDLPLLSSASGANLHIEGKALTLESQKPAYKLELKLPYRVQDDRGTAQFNKIKRQLVITVPVVQQNMLKLMQDQLGDIPERESESSTSPASPMTGGESESPPSEGNAEKVKDPTAEEDIIGALPEIPPECPIFTCSQGATSLTLVIHVKDVEEHSITSEVSSYQCEIRFCVKRTDAPYVLFVQFLPQYNLNTEDIAVKVSEDNVVIELTKSSECFGLWKNLYFGVNSNSLQERRFINEDNVTEFLESGLRPSTIPWSTLEDKPMINVLEMNDEKTCIQLNKPELEVESFAGPREAVLSSVKKRISYQSHESGLTDEEAEQSPPGEDKQCSSPEPLHDSSAEDEGLYFKEIPASELDEDDIPAVTGRAEPSPILQEVDAKDGSVQVLSDHKTQCAFSFDNALLFELD